MRNRSCLAMPARMALVGTMLLMAGGSRLLPLNAAAAVNSATLSMRSTTSTVGCGGTVAYSVVVTSTASQTITWFVDGIAKGNATVGTLTPNGDQTQVLYTAPAVGGTHVIKVVATNAAGAQVSKSTTLVVKGQILNTATMSLSSSTSTVGSGGSVAYSVAITSSTSQAVTWFVDGSAMGNATVGALTFNGDPLHALYKAPNAGGSHEVKAVATNASGSQVSKSTILTVLAPAATTGVPAITTQPQSVAVSLGQTATFTVTASSSAALSYQWRKNGTAISGATSASYTTPAAVASDTGARFVVAVTNAAGSLTSREAVLTVNASLPVIQSFSATPSTLTAGQGCILAWSGSGMTQLSLAPSVGDVSGLTTQNVNPTATTTYTLTARNAAGQTVSANTTVTVNPAGVAPTITVQPKSVSVPEGKMATFTVSATSATALNYQWRMDGNAIGGATASTYTTPVMTASDSGTTFTVAVSNGTSSVLSNAATLTVTPSSTAWYGFGANATGGSGKTVVHVTNLNDSGTGSFRAALGSNRTIVFDVGGTITLKSEVAMTVSNLTIDGSTAPSPGITFSLHGIHFNSCNNVILTNFRHRGGYPGGDATGDGNPIMIDVSSYNMVLDHLSLSGGNDETIDIFNYCHDITIQNCLFGPGMAGSPNYAMTFADHSYNLSFYHNCVVSSLYRNPATSFDVHGDIATGITGDLVNNLVWDYKSYGMTVYWGSKTNVIGNYFQTSTHPGESGRALMIESNGSAYSNGNYSKDGSSTAGSTSTAFTVPVYAQIKATSAIDAANHIKANVGCRVGGLDDKDVSFIDALRF